MTAIERLGYWVGRQLLAGMDAFLALPGRMQLGLVVAAALCLTVVLPIGVHRWFERRELRRLLAAQHEKLRWAPGVRP